MGRKGTVCYYPPEQLLRTNYPTPAIDIWGLAVVMFTYLTNKNPFPIKCKTNNIKAISSLVGSQKLWNMIKKYNLHIPEYKDFIEDLRKNPKIHSGVSLKDRVAPEK